MSKKAVIVTGASGFIGGAICIMFKQAGYTVLGIDKRRNHIAKVCDFFREECVTTFCQREDFNRHIIKDNIDPVAFIHCAGTSLVGPSITDPAEYYYNNVGVTAVALNHIVKHLPKTKFMFSSSASVYKTKNRPLKEDDETEPLSPYAKSKHMVEEMVKDYRKAYNLNYTIFRYFNACGAMGEKHGQDPGATHIFPRLIESIIDNKPFTLNGIDFKTKDGTCVRDYVHVSDIALAHLLAVENDAVGFYNLGSNFGFSNLEIIRSVEQKYNKKVDIKVGRRREGDSDCLIADTFKVCDQLLWTPYNNLNTILDDLSQWYNSETYMGLKSNATGNI